MLVVVWIALAAPLVFVADRLLDHVLGKRDASKRLDWRRIVVRLLIAVLSAVAVAWLFDVPGQIRFMSLLQRGDVSAAEVSEARPHPLASLNGWYIGLILVVGMLALGIHMVIRPEYWSQAGSAFGRDAVASKGRGTRFRAYGVLIIVLALMTAIGLAAFTLGTPR